MKVLHKAIFSVCVAAVLSAPLYAQSPATVETLEQLDGETAKLGEAIAQKLRTMGAGLRISCGEFYFEEGYTSLGAYLSNQLAAVLANRSNSGYTIVVGPAATVAGENSYVLGGEILYFGSALRVYIRLIRSGDSSLAAVWNADFAASTFMEDLMALASSSVRPVRRDSYEPDSLDAPVPAAPGALIDRTIHRGDDDWFLLTVETAGLLVLETTESSFDPVMELYDESGRNKLYNDDDGGDGNNPRIEVEAEAGQVFVVKVRGYDSGEAGNYCFQASLEPLTADAAEPNNSIEQATPLAPDSSPVQGLLRNRNDVDFYRLDIPEPGGSLKVYTESGIDTLLSLYDSAGDLLDEDDDSGNGSNARISRDVDAGPVYIEVRGYDGERGDYALHFEFR
jgi:hypothetical protein